MRRSRRDLDERSGWVRGLLVIVSVVIRGKVNRERGKKRGPVAGFVRGQVFVVEVRIAHHCNQRGNASRPRKPSEIYAAGGVDLRGSPVRSGDGCPKHVT